MKPETLGFRLAQERREKSARDRRDIGQSEIAAAAGVTQGTYSRYEADETKPDDDTLGRLAVYFNVSRAWLRYGEGEKRPLVTKGQMPQPTEVPNGEGVARRRKGEK